mmetsp:Transcript_14848/g.37757  ORF Transcript_14848/g.37757 Transcript_14848/m.37757 type:complete len:209 (+) Transcript_14848:225-851(+)
MQDGHQVEAGLQVYGLGIQLRLQRIVLRNGPRILAGGVHGPRWSRPRDLHSLDRNPRRGRLAKEDALLQPRPLQHLLRHLRPPLPRRRRRNHHHRHPHPLTRVARSGHEGLRGERHGEAGAGGGAGPAHGGCGRGRADRSRLGRGHVVRVKGILRGYRGAVRQDVLDGCADRGPLHTGGAADDRGDVLLLLLQETDSGPQGRGHRDCR